MNAEFFALAFVAALNPKLLGLDLLLIENRRPRAMFLCVLIGGLTVAVAFGLAVVLVARPDATRTQISVSAGLDLGLGLLLIALGGLVATGRLHSRAQATYRARDPAPKKQKKDVASWAQRALSEPRLGLAALVGVLVGFPGVSYLDALHNLIIGTSSTATQVVAVLIFVFIEFLLIIVPWALLELRPEATKTRLKKIQDWLVINAKGLMVGIALVLGAYLTIGGLVRLA
jgi:Sap, sulfolipid-1-addressing protein